MQHTYTLTDYGAVLRPVEESDAAFIVTLRTQPELAVYIGDTGDLASQQAWMRAYFQREGDYYFIVAAANDPAPLGTIAVYDAQDRRRAEWGRWVLRPGCRFGAASAALIYRFGFEVLGIETLYSRTVPQNKRVIDFHDFCGLPRTGVQANAVTIAGRTYDLIVHEATRADWPRLKRLLGLAARSAF